MEPVTAAGPGRRLVHYDEQRGFRVVRDPTVQFPGADEPSLSCHMARRLAG